ncbi:MAG: DUF805 domain-containing protein [Prevotella sp.]|nr:DUF805 domain-containing protein [Prevotella sp.]
MKELPSLGFIEAIKLASSRILDFSGRSRRSEFWWWILIIMIANWLVSTFISNLMISTLLAIIVMFFGLAVTARRLHDAGKSAWWVYISYAIGIVYNFLASTSPAIVKVMEEAKSGGLSTKTMEKMMTEHAGDFTTFGFLGLLMAIVALIVVIMCTLDSKPAPNKYGQSPKYVYE